MRSDRLTTKFQQALADAQSLAVGRDHQFIQPTHLMLAMLDQDGGTVRPLLDKSGVNVNLLTPPEVDPLSGTAVLNGYSVTVTAC